MKPTVLKQQVIGWNSPLCSYWRGCRCFGAELNYCFREHHSHHPNRLRPPAKQLHPCHHPPRWRTSGTSPWWTSALGPGGRIKERNISDFLFNKREKFPAAHAEAWLICEHTSTALNTNWLYFGVETSVECVVGEVGLRQTHLLQDAHFLLDHRPASAPKWSKL